MALAVSNVLNCPKRQVSQWNYTLKSSVLKSPPSFVRFPRVERQHKCFICASASAAGGSNDLNPYEVLGVNPIEGFDMVKAAYAKKRKEAQIEGDEVAAAQLEKAYDKLMMAQLSNRKKGVTYGSFKVSKDIKYADKQPIVPWGPRFSKSSENDMRINLAISAAFTAWILIKRSAEYKPLQFLAFAFVYRIFEKLKAFEPPVSPTYTEEVFGSMAFASLAYTGILNLIEMTGSYIPVFLYNNQELLITTATSVILYILASYYR
ncbi:CHLOROPLAST J-LIKE DOMAIN 1 [Salix purpurea]|uniref:CHLOROPLAST J-LIKE DOMAIN 1 n=1 Tax=Salix purpurea TaxID=77065 RepID=A0A9Q1A9A3_SALPP|nr:CHLOROPLAST J-LIKE DOMAIN 1 [Salix purpurea]